MQIEVVYAEAKQQTLLSIEVEEGSTVWQAIHQSRILEECPQIDLQPDSVGIFGQLVAFSKIVVEGDRIEIYRPLLIDPKEARRKRAKKNLGRTAKKNYLNGYKPESSI